MAKWKVVIPEAVTNYVLNPAAGAAGNFAAYAGATVTREDDYRAYGEMGYKIVPGAVNRGITLTCQLLPALVYVMFLAQGVTGTLSVSVGGATVTATAVQALGQGWTLYISSAIAGAATTFSIANSVSETWYIDGIMAWDATLSARQTYVDGEQPGCVWAGAAHGSASRRAASTRAGGAVLDLETDLYTRVLRPEPGITTPQVLTATRPFRAGAGLEGQRIDETTLTLVCVLEASSDAQRNARHMALLDAFKPDLVPPENGKPQPVRVQYWGENRVLELAGALSAPLAGRPEGFVLFLPIVLRAADNPYWEEVVDTVYPIDSQTSDDVRYIFGRDGETGRWTNVGPPASAGVDPGAVIVRVIIETDARIYVAGAFTDWDGIAGADRFVYWDKVTETWNATGYAGTQVRSGVIAPDGKVYLGTNVGNEIWEYNPDGDVFTDLTPVAAANGNVNALAWLPSVGLVAGGAFTSIDGVAADRVAWYDFGTSTWAQLGTAALDGTVYVLKNVGNFNLFAGGAFTGKVRWYNTSLNAWAGPAAGFINGDVYALDHNGVVMVIGGAFTQINSLTSDYIGWFNISAFYYGQYASGFVPLTPGITHGVAPSVDVIAYSRDGWFYIGGLFDTAGGLTLSTMLARLQPTPGGAVWEQLPIDLGSIRVFALSATYGVYLGLNTTTATGTWPGQATIETRAVPGAAEVRPVFVIRAVDEGVTLNTVRNVTGQRSIILEEPLLDGETVTIDLPRFRISSTFQTQQRLIQPLPGSQLASWVILPSDNEIDILINAADVADIEGYIRWRQRYHSYASADA